MAIEVTREVIEALGKAARRAHPREACGILLGTGHRITAFIETANIHPTPETHFEIDPQALIDAHRAARAPGAAQVLGYFHSHPTGRESPSATDAAMGAQDGSIWAIAAGQDIALWSDDVRGFRALSYCVVDL